MRINYKNNSAEEAKRYDEEPVSGPDIQIND